MRAEDAAAICKAIEAGQKLVTVSLELYPGSDERRPTTIVTAHVVALSEVEKPQRDIVAEAGDKVRGLWEYRPG